MKIMIVDDNPRMRRFLREQVLRLGMDAIECADGREAVMRYRTETPDVVLMDLVMPELDGITTTECIRRLDGRARICIITDYGDANFRSAASESGACAYFLKDELWKVFDYLRRVDSAGTPA